MRIRNIPGIEDKIEEIGQDAFIKDGTIYKGRWKEYFNNDQPIYIEIGSGKGRFITTLSRENPEINYLAIEKVEEVLYKVVVKLEKMREEEIPFHLGLLLLDGKWLDDIFSVGEIDRIYLNFSDPWPKKKHHKRRLTSKDFLKIYKQILKVDGELHLKTDNPILFEYSLNTLSEDGWQLHDVSLDYDGKKDVMTEYEEKFRGKGHPIYRLEAKRP